MSEIHKGFAVPSLLPIPRQLADLIASIKAKASDGLTIAEIRALVNEAIATGMPIVDLLAAPGPEKKALLLSYVGQLIDFLAELLVTQIIARMPAVSIARWVAAFVVPYVLPLIKQAILAAADAWLEQNYLTHFKFAE